MTNAPFFRGLWVVLLFAPLVAAQETTLRRDVLELPRKYDLRDVGVACPLTDRRAVTIPMVGIAADVSWFKYIPGQVDPRYQRYYVRDIEWFVIGENLENIDVIKKRIVSQGAIGTAMAVNKGL